MILLRPKIFLLRLIILCDVRLLCSLLLLRKYNKDPELDTHPWRRIITRVGIFEARVGHA
jgi:hypothetical protein